MHGLDLIPGYFKAEHLVAADFPLLNQTVTRHNNEKFPFGIVPMLTFGDTGLGNVHAELPALFGFEQFRETAPCVHIHFQRKCHLFLRKVGQVHRIQLLLKASVGNFRHHQSLGLIVETMQPLHNVTKGGPVGHRCGAVSAVLGQHSVHAVEGAVMLFSLQCVEHFLHQIVDKQHFQLHRRVVDRNGQVVCNIVAEGADRTVVVGAYPFAHQIRKTVDQNLRPGFLAVGKEQFLPCLFGKPVFRCAETPLQGGLNGG